jgi:cytochrome c-type biogenesis protein CcmH
MTAPLLVLLLALSVGTPQAGADLERDARAIDEMLVAPCCFSQQVSVHQSAAAQEVKEDVRRRLAGGETRQQILDAYVAQYGKHILAEPPATGFDLTLYVVPPIALVASLGLIALLIRRLSRPQAIAAPDAPVSDDDDARLDEELRDLD